MDKVDKKRDCRVNKKELTDVCCDCCDFLKQPYQICDECAVNKLKERIGH
jgi:hypothetical protein